PHTRYSHDWSSFVCSTILIARYTNLHISITKSVSLRDPFAVPIARFTSPCILIIHRLSRGINIDRFAIKYIAVPHDTCGITRISIQLWIKLIFLLCMQWTIVDFTPLQGPVRIYQGFGRHTVRLAVPSPKMWSEISK